MHRIKQKNSIIKNKSKNSLIDVRIQKTLSRYDYSSRRELKLSSAELRMDAVTRDKKTEFI